jgi:hypothetical protein
MTSSSAETSFAPKENVPPGPSVGPEIEPEMTCSEKSYAFLVALEVASLPCDQMSAGIIRTAAPLVSVAAAGKIHRFREDRNPISDQFRGTFLSRTQWSDNQQSD